jgi:hypothetical protein
VDGGGRLKELAPMPLPICIIKSSKANTDEVEVERERETTNYPSLRLPGSLLTWAVTKERWAKRRRKNA